MATNVAIDANEPGSYAIAFWHRSGIAPWGRGLVYPVPTSDILTATSGGEPQEGEVHAVRIKGKVYSLLIQQIYTGARYVTFSTQWLINLVFVHLVLKRNPFCENLG